MRLLRHPAYADFSCLMAKRAIGVSLHAGGEATPLDRERRIVVVSNSLPEMIHRDVAQAGSLPEEAPSSTHLPAWIEIVLALGDSPVLGGIQGRPHTPPVSARRSANSSSSASNPLGGHKGHRAALDIYLLFFSFFFFRLSFGLSWAFFCCSFLPLSLLPLSPISVSPCLNRPFPNGVYSVTSPSLLIVIVSLSNSLMQDQRM